MTRTIHTLCGLITALLLTASCISSEETTTILQYNDAAIVSFSLGNLKQHNDDGTTTNIAGSTYKFHIDQSNRRIYNTDSLPYGTDKSRVTCTATTLNNGVIVIKNTDDSDVTLYSSTDSIDFTTEREFIVYSSSMARNSVYTVEINVHQEDVDKFSWTQKNSSSEISALANINVVLAGGWPFVFGENNGQTVGYATSDGNNWQPIDFGQVLQADAWQNAVARNDTLFILNGNSLLSSADGQQWQTVNSASNPSRLIGASTAELYGQDAAGALSVSRDGGLSWLSEQYDEQDAEYLGQLPTENIALATTKAAMADSTDYVLMVGSRSAISYPNDTIAMVWRKITDYSRYGQRGQWVYMERTDNNAKALPLLGNTQLLSYADGIMAFGRTGNGSLSAMYQTRDGGITWRKITTYSLPTGLDGAKPFAAASKGADIWLVVGGDIWHGRLPRLSE